MTPLRRQWDAIGCEGLKHTTQILREFELGSGPELRRTHALNLSLYVRGHIVICVSRLLMTDLSY